MHTWYSTTRTPEAIAAVVHHMDPRISFSIFRRRTLYQPHIYDVFSIAFSEVLCFVTFATRIDSFLCKSTSLDNRSAFCCMLNSLMWTACWHPSILIFYILAQLLAISSNFHLNFSSWGIIICIFSCVDCSFAALRKEILSCWGFYFFVPV